jgi:hypothetical protein
MSDRRGSVSLHTMALCNSYPDVRVAIYYCHLIPGSFRKGIDLANRTEHIRSGGPIRSRGPGLLCQYIPNSREDCHESSATAGASFTLGMSAALSSGVRRIRESSDTALTKAARRECPEIEIGNPTYAIMSHIGMSIISYVRLKWKPSRSHISFRISVRCGVIDGSSIYETNAMLSVR